jgi:hypothetical protein
MRRRRHSPTRTMRARDDVRRPVFDYLLIGGVLSWVVGGILFAGGYNFRTVTPSSGGSFSSPTGPFAASTVRLYTKPDAVKPGPS